MSKVLVTGLAIGNEMGLCQVCNVDLSWLVREPSILLWSDEILLTSKMWKKVTSGNCYPEEAALSKCIKFFFEMCESEKIIKIIDPKKEINTEFSSIIYDTVEKDMRLLSEYFPKNIKYFEEKTPKQMIINNKYEYCPAYLGSIYASLYFARIWDAQCLFNEHDLEFCKFKYGLSGYQDKYNPLTMNVFKDIFNIFIPIKNILPDYVLYRGCESCSKEQICKEKYLFELENNIKNILKWRDYEEIGQVKSVINEIIKKKNEGIIDKVEVLEEFEKKERKIQKKINLIFPKVQRWSNIVAMLSVPIAVVGVATNNPLISLSGASLTGISKFTKEFINYLSNKYRWVSFISHKENEKSSKFR